MAKFLKSIFTTDKRKNNRLDGEEEDKIDFTPPLDGRRKLSISRSGRMRQAQKKRNSLSMELYGDNMQPTEKPKSIEYHTNPVSAAETNRRRSLDSHEIQLEQITPKNLEKEWNNDEVKTPEEEIEIAFKVIDKVS